MDDRFKAVVERMEDLINRYDNLYNAAQRRLDEVNDTQKRVEGLLQEAQDSTRRELDRLKKDSKDVLTSLRSNCDNQLKGWEDAVQSVRKSLEDMMVQYEKRSGMIEKLGQEAEQALSVVDSVKDDLKRLQHEYEEKVGYLVSSLSEKSKEVLEIHTELADIRESKEEAKRQFDEITEACKRELDGFQKMANLVADGTALGELGKRVLNIEKALNEANKQDNRR